MKVKTLALATTGSLLLTGAVSADFVGGYASGGVVSEFGVTFQVYATFDEGNENVTALLGTENSPLVMTSDLAAPGDGLGSGFFNSGFGGDTPNTNAALYGAFMAELDADTYLTIGLAANGTGTPDPAAFTPGFQAQLGGLVGSFSAGTPNGTLFVTPDQANAQVEAGGPTGFRLLLANITIAVGEQASGVFNVQWGTTGGGDGGVDSFTWIIFPAPGTLALLGLAGLAGTRRRRA